MTAQKRHLYGIFALAMVLLLASISWAFLGTAWRSVGRLVNEKVVTSRDSVELLYSSGWLRENANVYRCPKSRLSMPVITGPDFFQVTVDDLPTLGLRKDDVRTLLDRHTSNAIDWKTAKIYSGEGQVLLTLITVVLPEKGPDAFIYMFVF